MAERRTALVTCARVGTDDPVELKAGALQRPCKDCGTTLWVSATTLALEPRMDLLLVCNPCGKALIEAAQQAGMQAQRRIAPGALAGDTPAERRRRNELEAHGFQNLEEESP